MTAPAAVSVVIATRNRSSRLPALMEAIARQEGVAGFEVVVVDDASTDDTWAELTRLAASAPFPLRPVRMERQGGPARARNRGWRQGSAPIVAFTDDDCLPQPEWLAALLAAFDGADIVQGRTFPDPQLARTVGPFGHTVEVTSENGFYETCNIAYRRSLMERLDGFDETFRYPFGEDTDLAWRAKKAGGRSTFAPDALVQHEVRPSDFRAHVRNLRRGEGLVLAIRRHPEVRRPFLLGVFFSRSHPLALITAAAAVRVAGRPGSVARWALLGGAAAAYSGECMRTRQWPPRGRHWVTAAPLALAADLVQVGVFARASARYRTLFL